VEEILSEGLRSLSTPLLGEAHLVAWRGWIRFVHVAAFLLWAGPAMGASWFVYAAAWDRRKRAADAELLRRELWVRRQFNRVVAVEHLAFAALVVTGLMLAEAADWAYAGQAWWRWKLALVCLIFIPMEGADVVLSAWFGRAMKRGADGNAQDPARYARAARMQDLFLRATIPPVAIGIPVVLYLAVVKPL
jgi:uncharacterized membrane protein